MSYHYDETIDGPLVTHDKAAVVTQLQARVPDLLILHEQEDLRPFECDGLAAYRTTPMLVALPERTDQVQALLRFASEQRIPVVARGSGTGLSGGALPLEKGILLVMSRFNRILELDPEACTARVQPGVRNLAISQAAAPHGLYYAPDPSSQIACSIGGNVAENAGGIHCLKYGLTVNNILKLEILTIDGEHLTLGSEALDAPGFDLLALFTGSEGMLGIVAAKREGIAGQFRQCWQGRCSGGADHRRRRDSGRPGNDGQPRDSRRGRLYPRRLPRGCRGHPAMRSRRRRE
jgi:glycolate oxidase